MGQKSTGTFPGGRPNGAAAVAAALSFVPLVCAGVAAGGCRQIQATQARREAAAAYEDRLVGLILGYYRSRTELGKLHLKDRRDPNSYLRYHLAFAARTRETVREMEATVPPSGYEAVHRSWHVIFSDAAVTYEALGRTSDLDASSRLFHAWEARRDVQTKTAEREMKAAVARQEAAGRSVNPWFKRWRG